MRRRYSIGQVINGLTIVGIAGKGKHHKILIECRCECGSLFTVPNTKISTRKSCGCKRRKYPQASSSDVNYVLRQYERWAAKRKIPFALTVADFEVLLKGLCHYCGTKPKTARWTPRKTGERIKMNGIDRLNNDLGYFADNCVTCCRQCNIAKNNVSGDEFLQWVQRIYNRHFSEKMMKKVR